MSFEAEVRKIAEAVWDLSPGECQPKFYPGEKEVHEIDGVVALDDITHLIMVTTSTRLDKIKHDVKKLSTAEAIERRNSASVIKWIITETQLNAEHIGYAQKSNVTVITYDQFKRRFFDGSKYIRLRKDYAFGSARDPITDSTTISENAYVSLPMRILHDSQSVDQKARLKTISESQIIERLLAGTHVVVIAPFGSGKSLTTREIFLRLSQWHVKNPQSPIPLTINLRDHWGAEASDEIFDRHARRIAYNPRRNINIAWRAGMCALLLDGFDELAAPNIARNENKNFMREARKSALKVVRDISSHLPAGCSLFVCGRDHYFDSQKELIAALGLAGKKFIIVKINEFSEEKANEFLKKNGIAQTMPDWLPRKPLLLSYLLRKELFSDVLAIDSSKGFGHAWDNFLNLICQREAAVGSSSMDPETIRNVLERLADSVRAKTSGTGPINGKDLANAYTQETGQEAEQGVIAQLQRLPGLTPREEDGESRSFVDLDMLGALQGGAFARQILTNFEDAPIDPLSELSEKAIGMAIYLLSKNSATYETVITVADQKRRRRRDRISPQITADCFAIAVRMAIDNEKEEVGFRGMIVEGAMIDRIPLDEINVVDIIFQDCIINEVSLGSPSGMRNISFRGCEIARVSGASSRDALPSQFVSEDTKIEEFDNVSTNSAILHLDVSPQLKALLTVLRKLYKQPGVGRRATALSRGISRQDVLQWIDQVVSILHRHNFITEFNSVVYPVRKQTDRVDAILAAPSMTDDPVAIEVRALA